MALGLNEGLRTTRLQQVVDTLNSGKILVYGGERPAKGAPAPGAALVELVYPDPAYQPVVSGVAVGNQILGVAASGTGVMTWFRVTTSIDVFVFDGDIGTATSDADLRVSSVLINSGQTFTVTMPDLLEGNA